MTRWRLTILGMVILNGGLLIASFWLAQTPAQLAADAKPPDPSVLTAEVELRELSEELTVGGKFLASQSTTSITDASWDAPVVTALKSSQGAEVNEGEVVAEVSGRPVIILRGDTPFYRTLAAEATGRDVTMLQNALGRILGRPVAATGVFDAQTRRAIRDLYTARDYAPPARADDQSMSMSMSGDRASSVLAEIVLPRSEFIVVSTTPAVITSLVAPVGEPVTHERPAVTIAAGLLSFVATVDPSQATAVRVGLPVRVTDPSGLVLSGSIASVDDSGSSGGEVLPGSVTAVVTFPDDVPLGFAGKQSTAAIKAKSSTQAVPSLPIAALRDGPNGTLQVRLVPSGRVLIVKVPFVASGYAHVTGIDIGTKVALG